MLFLSSAITGGIALSRHRRERPPRYYVSGVPYQAGHANPIVHATNALPSPSPITANPGLESQTVPSASPDLLTYRNTVHTQYELGSDNPPTPELAVQPVVYEAGGESKVHDKGVRLQEQ